MRQVTTTPPRYIQPQRYSFPHLSLLGNVYFADKDNHRIRKITVSTGIITTIAGTGTSSYSGDNGQATAAALKYPDGIALDASGNYHYYIPLISLYTAAISLFFITLGNVYISDDNNNRVRKVTVSTGIITTVAGSSTSGSYSGDGGAATSATLNSLTGIALDSQGTDHYICNYSLATV